MPFIGKQSTSNSQITNYTTTVGSGGQTNFTVVIEGGDETHVYLNGVLLKETTDYTVSSTQVSLVSPAVENDIVEIKVFRSFALADAVRATGGTFSGDVTVPNLIIGDDGNIGSASDTDAITIDGSGNTTLNNQVGIRKSHATTSISGNTSSSSFPHALYLANPDTTTNTNFTSIGFSVSTSGSTSNAVLAGQSTSPGNMDLTFHTESGNTIAERLRIDSSGNVELKTTDAYLKLPSGGGINFHNYGSEDSSSATTVSNNLLDDYEQGTFSTTGYGKNETTTLTGAYRKIGSLVTIWVLASASGNQDAGNSIYCQGLPFTAGNVTTGSLGWQQRVNMQEDTVAYLDSNTNQFGGVTGSEGVNRVFQTVKDTGNYAPYLWNYSFTYYTS